MFADFLTQSLRGGDPGGGPELGPARGYSDSAGYRLSPAPAIPAPSRDFRPGLPRVTRTGCFPAGVSQVSGRPVRPRANSKRGLGVQARVRRDAHVTGLLFLVLSVLLEILQRVYVPCASRNIWRYEQCLRATRLLCVPGAAPVLAMSGKAAICVWRAHLRVKPGALGQGELPGVPLGAPGAQEHSRSSLGPPWAYCKPRINL